VFHTEEKFMKRLALALSAALCLTAVPALAGSPTPPDKPIMLAQVDVRVGEGGVRIREGDRDHRRHHVERDHDRGCRTITVREREGGHIVIRKTRRCD
jgi:hypothetical protein